MPRFAANLSYLFGEHRFLDRFAAAARAGFRAVECLYPYDHDAADLRRALDRHGLCQVLLNVPPGGAELAERGHGAIPGMEDAFQAGVRRAIAYATALGCPRIHVLAGVVPFAVTRADAEAAFVANLRWAATETAKHGIRCLIEPLNDRDNPGYFLTRTEDARRVIERVGADNLRLQFDFYHRQVMQGGLADAVRAHLDIIDHVQISGVPGRHEPDHGEIAYPYLFDLLDELGYAGWIGCEYQPRATTLEGLAWARPYGIGAA